ncbi:phage tail protein [Acinetobacter baumannii]
MKYKSIHTKKGLQLIAQAEATGSQIKLTHFAVGDGSGNAVDISESQTQLVRERYRSTINRVFQDPENDSKFTVELIIPLSVGGFVLREVGIFDSNGNLFIVGNLPDIQKPVASDGLFSGTVIRIPFFTSNASTIELKIDPNVVIATHSWVVNTFTPAYFFPGGMTGQVLKKTSNLDGEFEWGDASTAEIFVNTIEEEQTLATNQTIVDFTTVNTHGIAIYINGDRITNKVGEDGWQATSSTSITLGKAHPDGSKILAVQNEPLGAAPYPLVQNLNLSDIPDKDLARQNLGVESKFNDCPPGTILYLATANIPAGYKLIKANGAAISREVYADLFAVIGTTYGVGDGVLTFNVPDGRAEFPRGLDDGRGIDIGRVIGSKQTQQVLKHKHFGFGEAYDGWPFGTSSTKGKMGSNGGTDKDNYFYMTSDGSAYNGENTNSAGVMGDENRPRNIAWLCCIKY